MPFLLRLPCLPLGLSPGLSAWSAACRGTASGGARAGALTAAVSVEHLRRFRFLVRDSDAASCSPSTAFRWTSAERDDCADLAAAPPASATFGALRFPWSRSLILLISARSGSTMSLIRRSILVSASWRGRAEAWAKAAFLSFCSLFRAASLSAFSSRLVSIRVLTFDRQLFIAMR